MSVVLKNLMLGAELLSSAEAMTDQLAEWRRSFHQFPELAFEEHVTVSNLSRILSEIRGIEVIRGFGVPTSVIGVIGQGLPGPAVAIRAEMDAMSMQEETGLSFASCMPGVMHSVGNDAHMACLLGVAALLSHRQEQLKHPVVLLFQPAEEGRGGARPMLEAGLIEKFNIGSMLGLHWWPHLSYGRIFTRKGTITAFSDRIHIGIQGSGGHGASPHLTVDPVLISAHILVAIQAVLAHEVDPQETAVASFGRVEAGDSYNTIPEEAHLWGTLRSTNADVRKCVQRRIKELVPALAKAYRGAGTVSFALNYEQVHNNPALVDSIAELGASFLGEPCVELLNRSLLVGKDFSCYAQQVPSCLMFLGTGMDLGLYNARYDIPEALLPFASAWETYLALSLASQ